MSLVESSSSRSIIGSELEPDFTSIVPNDILLQIFLRLPHVLSVIRCSAVCKRWNFLISRLPNHFIRSFIQYHNRELSSSKSLPYTMLLFLFDDKLFYQIFSEESKILHRRVNKWSDSSCYLDFLPWPRVHVRASFNDLLLVIPSIYDPRPLQYCICNSLTRKWLVLPQDAPLVPNHPNTRDGLACKLNSNSSDDHEDDNDNNNYIKFKVVRLDTNSDLITPVDNGYVLPLTVFCSETGKWSQSTLFAPSALASIFTHLSEPIATSNGMLYFPLKSDWQEINESFTGSILAFDPFDDTDIADPKRGNFINRPAEFVPGGTSCFGVVKGQLRLSQCSRFNNALKIWELNYEHQNGNGPSAASWLLRYNGQLKRVSARTMPVKAFDPDDGDVVFVMSDIGGIYKYKIEEKEYEEVGQIPYESLSKGYKERYSIYMRSFTLVHPIWPTLIPTLP